MPAKVGNTKCACANRAWGPMPNTHIWAAKAAATPAGASSTTRQLAGGTANASAAYRKTSGAGLR